MEPVAAALELSDRNNPTLLFKGIVEHQPLSGDPEFCQYLDGVADAVHQPLLLLDSDLRIVVASRSFYCMFNLREKGSLGEVLFNVGDRQFDLPKLRDLLVVFSGNDIPVSHSLKNLSLKLSEGRIVRVSVRRLLSRDQANIMILLAFGAIYELTGTPRQLPVEINGEKGASGGLLRREEQFQSLVETMSDGLAVRDEAGLLTYVNGKLCEMLGYSWDEIIGRPVTDFLDEANTAIYWDQIAKRERGEYPSYDLTWTRKDGRGVNTIMSPKPIADSIAGIKGSFAVVTDITERKATEAALRASEKKLRQVSSHLLNTRENEYKRISRELHDELGQDLAVLKYQIRHIMGKLRKDQTEIKEASKDAMHQLETIIDSVRRISRDLSPATLESLGLTAALQKLIEDFAKHSNTAIHSEIDNIDDLLPQEAEVNLYRIVQEAMTNASKHAGATHLSIIVKNIENLLTARIVDNGKGFEKPGSAANGSKSGGLGLAIMEERARMVNGRLEINSGNHKGTEVSLTVAIGKNKGA